MPFNGAFTVEQTSNPSVLFFTDTSTGSDPNLTGRTITLINADGSAFGTYDWPIANSTISLNVLNRDVALNAVVDWASSDPLPDPSTYNYDQIYAFTEHLKQYVYYLTQLQTANPSISQDQNYYNNKFRLITEIESAANAITIGEDLFAGQQCIERGNFLIANPLNYF